MAGEVELHFWPSAIDCLDWSEDNIIAVAGGDSIGILSPRYAELGPNGSRWISTTVKANAFTAEEVPLFDPLSFRNFSLGEELSSRQVQALKWSARGLGKYGRCVLAVLSSNHVLSIWENVSKPGSIDAWSRVFIVNHALRVHYSDLKRFPEQTKTEFDERQAVAQRIRAFSWSPPVFDHVGLSSERAPLTDHGHQFLAVSTENEDILLLRILPQHDLLFPGRTEWDVEVIQRFNTTEAAIGILISQDPADNDEDQQAMADDTYVADHLAWGPVKSYVGRSTQSSLAFIANGRLFCAIAECNFEDERPNVTMLHDSCRNALSPRSDLTGPLRFVPETQFVVAFALDAIFCVDSARSFNDDKNSTYHHLDGRWDEITGVLFSYNSAKGIQMHMTSLLSSSTARTTLLSLPLEDDEVSTKSPWQAAIVRSKIRFSRQHRLGEHVQDRVWGLAASPMSGLIATATVLLPSDTINYITQAEQVTSINITTQAHSLKELLPAGGGVFRSSAVSTSVTLFELIAHLEDSGQSYRSDSLVEAIQQCAQLPEDWKVMDLDGLNSREFHPADYVNYLREHLFLAPDLRTARFKLIADLARKAVDNAEQVTKLVITNLVETVLQLPSMPAQAGGLSQRICNAHRRLRSRLNGQEPTMTDNSHSELCQICSGAIAFESVKWARCEKGHQFTRCGLTFLAMQEPGLSKSCRICATQYMDEYQLLGSGGPTEPQDVQVTDMPDAQQREDGEPAADETMGGGWVQVLRGGQFTGPEGSLARILFAAFDRCVYCGGTF